jgi:hypothetical protein
VALGSCAPDKLSPVKETVKEASKGLVYHLASEPEGGRTVSVPKTRGTVSLEVFQFGTSEVVAGSARVKIYYGENGKNLVLGLIRCEGVSVHEEV